MLEELYYRRQCVLNTIADLQAYFLRAYGAMEEDPDHFKPTTAVAVTTVPSIRQQPRQFQCRWAFGNSSACDAFHLGQIIRFFSLRTKTVFLGSTLIDPDFHLEPDADSVLGDEDADGQRHDREDHERNARVAGASSSDLCSLVASLKQCPDYQIDPNHNGCGVRRRLLPALDCIERFVGDGRGLLGIILQLTSATHPHLNARSPLPSTNRWWTWTNRSLRKAQSVDIRFSKIVAIHFDPGFSSSSLPQQRAASSTAEPLRSSRYPEEDARLFFTAKKRNWEA